jgi:hypothetical protein
LPAIFCWKQLAACERRDIPMHEVGLASAGFN